MSDRQALRRRCINSAWDWLAPTPDVVEIASADVDIVVDAVLAEIERDHVIVDKQAGVRLARAARVSDCFEDNGAPCVHTEDWPLIRRMLEVEVTPSVPPASDGSDR